MESWILLVANHLMTIVFKCNLKSKLLDIVELMGKVVHWWPLGHGLESESNIFAYTRGSCVHLSPINTFTMWWASSTEVRYFNVIATCFLAQAFSLNIFFLTWYQSEFQTTMSFSPVTSMVPIATVWLLPPPVFFSSDPSI